MARILVTGCAGFIGSHVAYEFSERGHTVVGVDDLSGGYYENIVGDYKFEMRDITNYRDMDYLFRTYKFDYVFHLAAYAAEGLSHFIRRFNYNNNLIGSINLINCAVNYKISRFIFTSSMAVYGSNQVPFSEDMTPNPEDPYGIAKYAVEMDLRCAKELWGLNYTIFRPHNVSGGVRQNIWDTYRNVVGIFIYQAMHNKPLTVFGDGEQTRAFSHIDDIVTPIIKCIDMPETENEIFNIGGDTPFTINQLAETVKRIVNPNIEIIHLPPRVEVKHAHCSHEKIRKFFNYKSGKTLDDIVTELYEWAKTQPDREPTKWEFVEINEKLPPKWKELLK